MPYIRTDDPVKDFDRHDRAQSKRLAELPECSICGNPIQDDHYYEINDENICPECLDDHFRKEVDL